MRPAEQRLPSRAQSPRQVYNPRAWVCARYRRHQRQNHKHLLNKQLGSSPICTALILPWLGSKRARVCVTRVLNASDFARFAAPILHRHKKKSSPAPSVSYCNSPESLLAGVSSHAVTRIVPLNAASTTCIHTQERSQLSRGHGRNRYGQSSFLCSVLSTGSGVAGPGWATQGE